MVVIVIDSRAVFPHYIVSAVTFLSMWLSVNYHICYLFIWLRAGLVPLSESFLTIKERKLSEDELASLAKESKWKYPIWLLIFTNVVCYFWCLHAISSGCFTVFEILQISFATLLTFPNQVFACHEIIHRKSRIGKAIAAMALFYLGECYFLVEHLDIHHKDVGTAQDPDSAPLGTSIYSYLIPRIINAKRLPYEHEAKRLAKKGLSPWSLRNRMILLDLFEIGMFLLVLAVFGFTALLVSLLLVILGRVVTSVGHYAQHYGLTRKEISPGVFEPTTARHSWNSAQGLVDFIYFKVPRHSDHHNNPYKPYQILTMLEDGPQYPIGYAQFPLVVFNPKLWFEIVDPIAIKALRGEKPTREEWESGRSKVRRASIRTFIIHSVLALIATFS